MKNKKQINYTKERAVLSDVHPYEVPITFSNRYFYRFLVDNNIELKSNRINHRTHFIGNKKDAFEIILKILFSNNLASVNIRKIPFTYRISHKKNDFRELALVHPLNQLKLVNFYDQFKELITYSCSISNFSLRRPVSVAKYVYFNDKLHQSNKGDNSDFLELHGKEYENLKTFFSYKKYTNIYRFYEDYRYQRAEKKYNHLFKFDITKCFDSIYSHSIAWAILGIDVVKENVKESKETFGGLFDQFVQNCNYGETNGIVIGPEFSRIFAEIILQRVDKTLEEKLMEKGYYLKKHYELYRYVDDYFLFCDDLSLKEEILLILRHELKKYKLSINDLKSIDYNRPIITEISIAKDKIIQLFKDEPRFDIFDDVSTENDSEGQESISIKNIKYNFHFDSNNLATKYKIIIKESKIDYKDILNYSLFILNKKIEKNLTKFDGVLNDLLHAKVKNELSKSDKVKLNQLEYSFTSHIEKFIDFVFFLYAVSPRVNSTIKTSNILSKIIKFYKEKANIPGTGLQDRFSENNRNRIFKKILDEAGFVLNKNSVNKYAQIESLYLITVLKELGREYYLSEQLLSKYLDCKENKIEIGILNYFSIVVSFFYIGHSKKYLRLKESIENYTLDYVNNYPKEKRGKSSEISHLILDLFACPYLDEKFKKKLLISYRSDVSLADVKKTIKDAEKLFEFHKTHKYWFTKWERLNLTKELENKRSQEVYS